MTRKAIESSKKLKVKQNKVVYCSEMTRNVIKSDFGHPKWPPVAILWKKLSKISNKFQKKIKVACLSEMTRNVIESDFRSSKMATGGDFVK